MAAAVDASGIANFVTFLELTGAYRRALREAEYGSLETHRAFLESISPLAKVDAIVTPLMVIHGANDPRVPVEEAEQIVTALRERGRRSSTCATRTRGTAWSGCPTGSTRTRRSPPSWSGTCSRSPQRQRCTAAAIARPTAVKARPAAPAASSVAASGHALAPPIASAA